MYFSEIELNLHCLRYAKDLIRFLGYDLDKHPIRGRQFYFSNRTLDKLRDSPLIAKKRLSVLRSAFGHGASRARLYQAGSSAGLGVRNLLWGKLMFRAIFKTFVSADSGFDGPLFLFGTPVFTLGHELVYEQSHPSNELALEGHHRSVQQMLLKSGGETGASVAPISRC